MISTLIALALQAAPAAPSGAPPGGPAAPAGPLGACGGGQSNMLIPMVMIFVVFYFMLIRPQQKKQKEVADWLKSLKKGDEVVTTGGLIGKISGLTDNTVTLELQEKVRVKVLRSHIAGKPPAPGQPAPEPQPKS
jgi:preprotein translocase subunit YajC